MSRANLVCHVRVIFNASTQLSGLLRELLHTKWKFIARKKALNYGHLYIQSNDLALAHILTSLEVWRLKRNRIFLAISEVISMRFSITTVFGLEFFLRARGESSNHPVSMILWSHSLKDFSST